MEYKHRKKYVEVIPGCINYFADSMPNRKRPGTTLKELNQNSNPVQTTNLSLSTSQDVPFLDLPDKVFQLIISFLAPVDKLKILLINNSYRALAASSLRDDKVDLKEFYQFFTFDETRQILSTCSRYLDKLYFIYKDGMRPKEYLAVMESHKKDFIQVDVDSAPENFFEDTILLFEGSL